MFNVSKATISHIYHGDTWADIYNIYKKSNSLKSKSTKFDDDIIRNAKKLINEGIPIKDISSSTGISEDYLYSLKYNKYKKEIK